jgi:hypothetical protein
LLAILADTEVFFLVAGFRISNGIFIFTEDKELARVDGEIIQRIAPVSAIPPVLDTNLIVIQPYFC